MGWLHEEATSEPRHADTEAGQRGVGAEGRCAGRGERAWPGRTDGDEASRQLCTGPRA